MRQASRVIVIKDDRLLIMRRDKFGYKYCALVGGSLDVGETAEQALYREVREETTIEIANPRLVIIEDAGPIYGIQYIYQADYASGEPKLEPNAIEAKITSEGKNLYQPAWLPLKELATANLLPQELKATLLEYLPKGFPGEPIKLTVQD